MTTQEIAARFDAKKQGKEWRAFCPAHDGKSRSLSIEEGRDGATIVTCWAKCDKETVLASKGLTMADLFAEKKAEPRYAFDCSYDYRDRSGDLLFQAVRKRLTNPAEYPTANPKQFTQRRPNGQSGWIYNLEGVRRVIYRLPELLAADPDETVFLVEGEKDVDRLRAGGLVATCSPMGAGKWRDEYADHLTGRNVAIIPDNDDPGRAHAQDEAKSLHGKAGSVKMLTLAGLPEKGDVSDWLSLGGTVETLRTMAEAAPRWTPGAGNESPANHIAISWGELCEMKLERRETILHEVERGEIVMIPAITNRGKTTLCRNMALSLACGREFDPIVKDGPPRSVLYADFETRLYRARADITKMLGKLEQSERALISTNFHLIADCRINGRPLTLSDPSHLAIVEKESERVKADVVILDTLTAAFEIADENSNAEASSTMKKLTAMALKLNCVIVFLHHIGKQKLEEGQTAQAVHRARGASAYSGFSHAIFGLLPHPKDPALNILECAKVKGEKFVDRSIKLDPETRWFANLGGVEKAPNVRDQLVGIFNGKPLKRAAILDLLPTLSQDTVDRELGGAVKDGLLIKQRNGREVEYKKLDKNDTPHNPQAYRDADSADSRIEVDKGLIDFGDFPENELAEYFDDPALEAIDR